MAGFKKVDTNQALETPSWTTFAICKPGHNR
jgi:hypothetical protein